jgi:hypothetical protein
MTEEFVTPAVPYIVTPDAHHIVTPAVPHIVTPASEPGSIVNAVDPGSRASRCPG